MASFFMPMNWWRGRGVGVGGRVRNGVGAFGLRG